MIFLLMIRILVCINICVCGVIENRSLDYLSQENLFKSGVSFTELEETLLDEEVEACNVVCLPNE